MGTPRLVAPDVRRRRELERILPPAALSRYLDLCGGIFGDTLDDVIRFALITFLHDRVATLQYFEPRIGEQVDDDEKRDSGD